jgi:hypothetical protein
MLLVDRMLVGGIRFVLGKIAAAVESELNDDARVREELLAAQMRAELGELAPEEYQEIERALLARLREIRQRTQGDGLHHAASAGGIEVTAEALEDEGERR